MFLRFYVKASKRENAKTQETAGSERGVHYV
jgi:hypothetical protein